MTDETKALNEHMHKPNLIFRKLRIGLVAILTLIAYLTIVTFSIPIYIFRVVVIYLAKRLRPDLGTCLNALSAYLVTDLFSGKAPRCATVLPITLNGNLTREELVKIVKKNWIEAVEENGDLKYPQFKNYTTYFLGFPFWKSDPNFDVGSHVFSYAKEHGDSSGCSVTEEDLDRFVEKMLNAPLRQGKSPWELHVVENYRSNKFSTATSPELSAMVMRIHHSMGDGYSLLDALVAGLFEKDLNELELPKVRYPHRTLRQKLMYYATIPIIAAYEFSFAFASIFKECPWKVSDSDKSWHQRYAKSELISIENLKHTKNVLGVGFTSVLLSAISAGIYKSLEDKRKNNTLRIEKEDDYMICMTALPLPETEATKKIRLKNNVTGLIFNIPANYFATSVDRLKKCHHVLEACKNSVVPWAAVAYVNTVGSLCGNLSYTIGKNRMISTGLTNFPTKPKTSKTVTIAGNEIIFAEFASGGLVGNAGVGFMVISFYPWVRLAVTAESSVLSRDEIRNLVKYIEEELNILHSVANQIKPNN